MKVACAIIIGASAVCCIEAFAGVHRVTATPIATTASTCSRGRAMSMGPLLDFSRNKASKLPPLKLPEGFQVPEPRPLTITKAGYLPVVASGALALAVRAGMGVTTLGWKPAFGDAGDDEYALKLGPVSLKDGSELVKTFARPKKPVVLYEYEASPFCRKVREACAMLDLTVSIRPCPQGADTFRAELETKGGKQQIPYMVDQNTATTMYESDDIIAYLFDTYGPGADQVPGLLKGTLAVVTSGLASVARGSGGRRKRADALPENPLRMELELWGYEASPFVKPVRELLSDLELPHKFVFCARGSANRDLLVKKTGRFQVPYLVDPNTGIEMFESAEIVDYLTAVYTSAGATAE